MILQFPTTDDEQDDLHHVSSISEASSTSEIEVILQVIDDSIGNTLVAASTLTPEIREKLNGGGGGNTVRRDYQ